MRIAGGRAVLILEEVLADRSILLLVEIKVWADLAQSFFHATIFKI